MSVQSETQAVPVQIPQAVHVPPVPPVPQSVQSTFNKDLYNIESVKAYIQDKNIQNPKLVLGATCRDYKITERYNDKSFIFLNESDPYNCSNPKTIICNLNNFTDRDDKQISLQNLSNVFKNTFHMIIFDSSVFKLLDWKLTLNPVHFIKNMLVNGGTFWIPPECGGTRILEQKAPETLNEYKNELVSVNSIFRSNFGLNFSCFKYFQQKDDKNIDTVIDKVMSTYFEERLKKVFGKNNVDIVEYQSSNKVQFKHTYGFTYGDKDIKVFKCTKYNS